MKVTAAPSRRNTNNERLFLFTARAAAPRSLRVRSILVYCADYHCSHSARSAAMAGAMSGCPTSRPRFVCQACGKRSADNEVGLQLEPAAGGP